MAKHWIGDIKPADPLTACGLLASERSEALQLPARVIGVYYEAL